MAHFFVGNKNSSRDCSYPLPRYLMRPWTRASWIGVRMGALYTPVFIMHLVYVYVMYDVQLYWNTTAAVVTVVCSALYEEQVACVSNS